jgi:hypothetical protein
MGVLRLDDHVLTVVACLNGIKTNEQNEIIHGGSTGERSHMCVSVWYCRTTSDQKANLGVG